jgi:hypothetical protein
MSAINFLSTINKTLHFGPSCVFLVRKRNFDGVHLPHPVAKVFPHFSFLPFESGISIDLVFATPVSIINFPRRDFAE